MEPQLKKPVLLFTLVLLPILLVYLLSELVSSPVSTIPKAHQGVLDLSNWDFPQDGVISLDGEWEFYWQQLLSSQDFHQGKANLSGYGHVPSMWNYYNFQGKHLPGYGYATYRLKVKVKDRNSLQGLKITTMSTAYKLMVDNSIVATNGTVSTDKETFFPQYKPLVTFFQPTSNQFELIVQVANFTYARGGFCYTIYLGTEQQIRDLQETKRQRDIFLLGSIFIMALYHSTIFLLHRKYKYKAELYFILMMILFAMLISFRGEYVILSIFPKLSINWLVFFEYTTIYWASGALALFMQELYPDECSPRIRNIIVGISIFLTLLTLINPISFYTKFTLLIEIELIIVALYYIYTAWLAVIRNRVGAPLLFSTIIFSIGAFLLDALYHWNIYSSKFEGVFPIVSFVFIFVQSFILAQRSSVAFTEVDALSRKLISLNKLKDEFIANTSHELRTPLHGMISITEAILESTAGNLTQEQKESLALVVSSGKRLANLVNDILDYEKLKHGDLQLNKQNIYIQQAVPAVLEISRYLSGTKNITLVNKLPQDLPAIVADENRFTQIIYNLLGNAFKFTQEGEITISAIRNQNMVEISVEDTGIGIPKDKIKGIFKSFEQIDTSLISQSSGTGLGLSITKYLVEIHGGKIWVDSSPGKGSIFTFSMPVSIAHQKSNQGVISQEMAKNSSICLQTLLKVPAFFPQNSNFTVLVVDDDYINLQGMVSILAAENYSAIAVDNGIDALDTLKRNKNVDLVILDIMLPNLSGYEVCQKIREKYSLSELPVLMMTAQNSAHSQLTGFAAGANDFLTKPFDSNELKARMKTLLQLKNSFTQAIQTEMAFLQAQIKPHFLYNALNTIMSFCWTDGEKAGNLLLALSDYLRGSFNFNNMNQFNSLENELEFVQSYITIEQARFGEKLNFQYEISVPLDFVVPTLIIQPLVENSIKHGILPKKEGGEISISIKQQGQIILLEIKDNGVGIPQDKIAKILTDSPDKGVGLRNINRRLIRLYGSELEFISEVNRGTIVKIKIPVQRKENDSYA